MSKKNLNVVSSNTTESNFTRKNRVDGYKKREKEAVTSARYYIKHGQYDKAIDSLAWALQQRTVLDELDYQTRVLKSVDQWNNGRAKELVKAVSGKKTG